jgi:hypothetical protein
MGLERSGPPRQPYEGVIWRWPDGAFLNSGQASNENPYAHFTTDTMTALGLWSPHYAYLAQGQGWEYTNVSCAAGPIRAAAGRAALPSCSRPIITHQMRAMAALMR